MAKGWVTDSKNSKLHRRKNILNFRMSVTHTVVIELVRLSSSNGLHRMQGADKRIKMWQVLIEGCNLHGIRGQIPPEKHLKKSKWKSFHGPVKL